MIKHIMIDLETLSTKPNALVLAIGVCEIDFLRNDIGHKFYTSVDHTSYGSVSHDVDVDTVMWWMQQSDDARKAIIPASDRLPMVNALEGLSSWICGLKDLSFEGNHDVRVWGNGVDFDNTILAHFFKEFDVPMPWSFRDNRCFRTVKNLFPDTPDPADCAIDHHALHDAEWQANKLILINNRHNLGL